MCIVLRQKKKEIDDNSSRHPHSCQLGPLAMGKRAGVWLAGWMLLKLRWLGESGRENTDPPGHCCRPQCLEHNH